MAGSLGDVGVLFPIALALIRLNGLNATSALLTAGLLYIGAGLYYRLPLPVQPLKAVSAIAIAFSLSPSTLAAAGIIMGGLLLVLGVTGWADTLARFFTKPIIRGIQLGIGLILVKTAIDLMGNPWAGAQPSVSQPGPASWTGYLVGVGCFLLILYLRGNRRFPASLVVLTFGALVGLAITPPSWPDFSFGPVWPAIGLPSAADFTLALTALVIPQVPLTFGNAIVATADLSRTYFGDRGERVTPSRLAGGMGLANLLAGLIGGLPVCHGSGGLTAHYKFGARTGAAPIMIGLGCCLLGLAFGATAVWIIGLIPLAVLGAFLLFVGLEHCLLIADLRGRDEFLIALATASVSVATGNLTVGFAAGFLMQFFSRPAGYADRTG
ncbi:MAG: molybdate transporter family protein [Candidatus Methylomirabilales bacterium]